MRSFVANGPLTIDWLISLGADLSDIGLHGANRLGVNGVGDIVVNGKIAGRNAAEEISAN